jgi:hypothetical protein
MKNHLLIVERSYATGKQACTIKVYLCDLAKATDVREIPSLQNQNTISFKKLILNMDDLGFLPIILITLVQNSQWKAISFFVSDNNFSDKQKTQVLLFEIE